MKNILQAIFLMLGFGVQAQQTLGLFFNDTASYNGYTLLSPVTHNKVYLLDNCGNSVYEWTMQNWTPGTNNGLPCHLLPSGLLLRSVLFDNTLSAGGQQGRLKLIDANSNEVWAVDVADLSTGYQHHDLVPMPNGNILIMAWVQKSELESIAAGRNAQHIPTGGLWTERIMEIHPIGTDSMQIVWQWDVWDHLVQNFDAAQSNYGVVANHPELIDVNFILSPIGSTSDSDKDWIHFNGIDYNPVLDQILLSSRKYSEIYVIDHSTTTAQAASHSGGTQGKGGDILYRWGNPQVYDAGTAADEQFFGQHGCSWIPQGYPNAGQLMVFNNGAGSYNGNNYSSVVRISPPIDATGDYAMPANGQPFLPAAINWSYGDGNLQNFYSGNISSAQALPNGNTLICVGNSGEFIEVTASEQMVWRYQNPINVLGTHPQGTVPNVSYSIFKTQRYAQDYIGLPSGLNPGVPLELNPLPSTCVITPEIVGVTTPIAQSKISIFPNPCDDYFRIAITESLLGENWIIYDLLGQLKMTGILSSAQMEITTSDMASGIYFVEIGKQQPYKIVKY